MGLLQFFRRFIKDFRKIATPLTDLTKKGQGIKNWNTQCGNSFESLNEALTSASVLSSSDWRRNFRGNVDASNSSIGGTLTQLDDCGKDPVISFFAKKLSPSEKNYTTNYCELLGLIYFFQKFRCYLKGRFWISTSKM